MPESCLRIEYQNSAGMDSERADAGRPESVRPPELGRGRWGKFQTRDIHAELRQFAQMMPHFFAVLVKRKIAQRFAVRFTSAQRDPPTQSRVRAVAITARLRPLCCIWR
jgi:hypothetical protein